MSSILGSIYEQLGPCLRMVPVGLRGPRRQHRADMNEPILHCWEDGPRDERDVGSTCMLPDGHDGPHEWTPDDEITVRFA